MLKDIAPLPGYPEPYGLLCASLQDATADWRSEIWVDFGPEVTTWRARPNGQSIGGIFLHMIQVEIFWLEMFVLGYEMDRSEKDRLFWDETNVDRDLWPEPYAQPLSWYYKLQEEYRARTLEFIKRWPAADTLLDREGEPHKYTPRWVLSHVVQHEAYHGGQIVMLGDLWAAQNKT